MHSMTKGLAALITLTAALVAGCQQSESAQASTGLTTKSLTVTSTSTTTYQYYDLSTGAEVSDPATTDWDIAFSSSTGGIRTNSGVTATSGGSSGTGGVYYAGTTDFDTVTSYDATAFSGEYAVDVTKYVATNNGTTTTTSATVLNVMTKLDYSGGTGTDTDPFTNDASTGVYDGEAYYSYSSGAISASGEVYVIRHGDGKAYTKLQIVTMTGSSSSRVRTIKYANF